MPNPYRCDCGDSECPSCGSAQGTLSSPDPTPPAPLCAHCNREAIQADRDSTGGLWCRPHKFEPAPPAKHAAMHCPACNGVLLKGGANCPGLPAPDADPSIWTGKVLDLIWERSPLNATELSIVRRCPPENLNTLILGLVALALDRIVKPAAAAIRRATLEEAAQLAWRIDHESDDGACGFQVADAIRALSEKPAGGGGTGA